MSTIQFSASELANVGAAVLNASRYGGMDLALEASRMAELLALIARANYRDACTSYGASRCAEVITKEEIESEILVTHGGFYRADLGEAVITALSLDYNCEFTSEADAGALARILEALLRQCAAKAGMIGE